MPDREDRRGAAVVHGGWCQVLLGLRCQSLVLLGLGLRPCCADGGLEPFGRSCLQLGNERGVGLLTRLGHSVQCVSLQLRKLLSYPSELSLGRF